jgi:hypothetical protein
MLIVPVPLEFQCAQRAERNCLLPLMRLLSPYGAPFILCSPMIFSSLTRSRPGANANMEVCARLHLTKKPCLLIAA